MAEVGEAEGVVSLKNIVKQATANSGFARSVAKTHCRPLEKK